MRLLRLTLPRPAENLALDEALLTDPGGADSDGGETLRVWESADPFVVLGRSSRVDEEVDRDASDELGVPVLRRVSGGASIVTGPGCLMYAVVVDLVRRPELADLGAAHAWVLERVARAASRVDPTAGVAGTSDLVVRRDDGLRKFSGNSLRRVRDRLLYHGTLLYDFDLPLVSRLLRTAPRQPEYRSRREHDEFIANLACDGSDLVAALAESFVATPAGATDAVLEETARLAETKYTLDEWNLSR